MKKTIIINKNGQEGFLECTWSDNDISVLSGFENRREFNLDSTYILELLSAKKPNLKPYKMCEAKFSKSGVTFSGSVSHKTLSGYGYIPLDIDTFVITERKINSSVFTPFIKAFTGLVWNVDSKYNQNICTAIESAKEKLESIKPRDISPEYIEAKEKYLKIINSELLKYNGTDLMPAPYKWYFVNGGQPVLNLSSLKHALFNPEVCESIYENGGYYMGIYNNHIALACAILDVDMMFFNMQDVSQVIYDTKHEKRYSTVGIVLEDDGQYFEKILAIETK